MPVLQPVGTQVLLEIISRRDDLASNLKRSSGLLIPEKVREGEPNQGRVYAVGQDVPEDRIYIIGDTVVFSTKEVFQGFEFEGKKLISVEHYDIQAIIK